MSGSSSALLQAARLWERTGGGGTRYMQGRLGGVKVVILPNRDFAADDPANSHTHTMFFQDGSPTQPRQHALIQRYEGVRMQLPSHLHTADIHELPAAF